MNWLYCIQPYRTNYRPMRKAGISRGGLPQGRAHKLVVGGQMSSPGNRHSSSLMHNDMVIFTNRCICVYACSNNW